MQIILKWFLLHPTLQYRYLFTTINHEKELGKQALKIMSTLPNEKTNIHLTIAQINLAKALFRGRDFNEATLLYKHAIASLIDYYQTNTNMHLLIMQNGAPITFGNVIGKSTEESLEQVFLKKIYYFEDENIDTIFPRDALMFNLIKNAPELYSKLLCSAKKNISTQQQLHFRLRFFLMRKMRDCKKKLILK